MHLFDSRGCKTARYQIEGSEKKVKNMAKHTIIKQNKIPSQTLTSGSFAASFATQIYSISFERNDNF